MPTRRARRCRRSSRSMLLMRANARTASSLACRRCLDRAATAGRASGSAGRRPGARSRSAPRPRRVLPRRDARVDRVEVDRRPRSRPTSDSAVKPTQLPEKRDSAQPYRPNSRYSATLAGATTGIVPGLERLVALVRHRRRDAAVVVARHHQHAAVRRRAVRIAVLQRIAGAIDARALAVPEREHAFDGALRDRTRRAACPAPRSRRVPR